MADFEKNHPGIAAQELWKLFVDKANEQGLDRDFISAVGEVCAIGLDLSKYIIRFFPTFTLHDETHSANVCRWMWVLLGERREQLTAHEAALLLMAACCHDIGMAVSPEQEERMRLRTYPGWDEYFQRNLKDDEVYEETKEISDRMMRNFVRMHHHERVGEILNSIQWHRELVLSGITREALVELCSSHGRPLDRSRLKHRKGKYDLLLCAVLLRLADLLDYDAKRAPEILFFFRGLDKPRDEEEARSAREYEQNQSGNFDEVIEEGAIRYNGVFQHPRQEQSVMRYLEWVQQELKHCDEELRQTNSEWQNLRLPYRIDTESVERIGYEAGDFCMTMDQDRVIDLLVGESLYSDPGVFVRELLQNSIDAVLMRAKQDPDFSLEQGAIRIDTWRDQETGDTWFRICDNGTGMDKKIIKNHFLKVGNSYYTSEEFRYANRHAAKGSYTAISRFGIGILSCFMGDKERTELKVSTKRFPRGRRNGIRLDVTGLRGQYFLSNEGVHSEYVERFHKMPSPDSKAQGHRTEPGTTICVRTNLIRMGETRSFLEILDKYVQFPEVRVIYNGPEGHKEYTTQQKLMKLVYALNPDGVVRTHEHEVPDEEFEKIKEKFPYYRWESRPKVVLCYEPLDWLSDSKMLTGVQISVAVKMPKCQVGIIEDREMRGVLERSELETKIQKFGVEGLKFHLNLKDNVDTLRHLDSKAIRDMRGGSDIVLPLGKNTVWLSDCEQRLWEFLLTAIQNAGAEKTFKAYNGVFAETGSQKNSNIESVAPCSAVLLREEFLPQVNMARSKITGIPPEAACCMAMGGLRDKIPNDSWKLATERELWELLDRHPNWTATLEKETRDGCLRNPQDALWLAHWKRKCRVSFDGRRLNAEINTPADAQTAAFPAGMFVWMKDHELARREIGGNRVYSRSHPFSVWVQENQVALSEQVPTLYDTMIKTMMMETNRDVILETLNRIIELLRRNDENPFRVPADLVLTKEDIW